MFEENSDIGMGYVLKEKEIISHMTMWLGNSYLQNLHLSSEADSCTFFFLLLTNSGSSGGRDADSGQTSGSDFDGNPPLLSGLLSGRGERNENRKMGVSGVGGAGGGYGRRRGWGAADTSDAGFPGGGGETCLSPQSSDGISGFEGEGER